MKKVYSNNRIRTIALILRPKNGLFVLKLAIVWAMLLAIGAQYEDSQILILILSGTLVMILIAEWLLYYRFLVNYYRTNRNAKFSIDTERHTLCNYFDGFESDTEHSIRKVVLHRHYRSERPFKAPVRWMEHAENYLNDSPNRFLHSSVWYIEVFTEESNPFIITPLMSKLKKVPFKHMDVFYDKKPLIKL